MNTPVTPSSVEAIIFEHSGTGLNKQVWFQRGEVESIVRAALAERTQQEALTDAQAHTALGARGYREAYDAGYRAATSAANSTAPMQPSDDKWRRDELWHSLAKANNTNAYLVRDIVLGYLESLAAPTQDEPAQPSDDESLCMFTPGHAEWEGRQTFTTPPAPTQAAGGDAVITEAEAAKSGERLAWLRERLDTPEKRRNWRAAPAAAVDADWTYDKNGSGKWERAAAAPEGLTELRHIASLLSSMFVSSRAHVRGPDEEVFGYTVQTGALHKIVGILQGLGCQVIIPASLPKAHETISGILVSTSHPATPDAKTAEERKPLTPERLERMWLHITDKHIVSKAAAIALIREYERVRGIGGQP